MSGFCSRLVRDWIVVVQGGCDVIVHVLVESAMVVGVAPGWLGCGTSALLWEQNGGLG